MTIRIDVVKVIRFLLLITAVTLAHVSHAARQTIVDLQPNTQSTSLDTVIEGRHGFARLTNLNTDFNIWYLLDVSWPGETGRFEFHLENPDPKRYAYQLDPSFLAGLLIIDGAKTHRCRLWAKANSELRAAPDKNKTFVSICDNRVLVRNTTEGQETTREFVADFLRKHVWGGETITGLVKDYLYKDKYLITSETRQATEEASLSIALPNSTSNARPRDALIDAKYKGATIEAEDLGISLKHVEPGNMVVGQWFPTTVNPHIFVSAIQPRLVDNTLFQTHTNRVRKLDAVEASATVYLIAFKLSKFDLGFALGTLHPSAEWSYRAPDSMKDPGKPGPDGIDHYRPLVMVGKVNPIKAPKVVATFTGGFKRTHGAFKWGKLSEVNQASHYGFRVNGVNFSTLQPDLASLLIYRDGNILMKTWTTEDDTDLPGILHARQNGVPIIEWDPQSGQGIPSSYVGNWANGNWSGSAQSEQRTLRAGTCIQQVNGESFLIFGYFSSVTPNAMARVFQSYHCRYAMHLDMNGLEHTYLALYIKNDNAFEIQHLVKGMSVLDKKEKGSGTMVPRYLGTADNRDFFYVMEKD